MNQQDTQLLQQAVALHQQGRLAEAEPLYVRLLQRQPRQFEATNYLGVLKLQQGQFERAATLFSEAHRLRPTAPDVLSNRGIALQSLGRLEEAVASYDRAVALKSDYVDALFNRANALRALGRYIDAVPSYDRALALRPDFAPAWSNRGNTLQLLGRHEDALASYDRALALRPGNADALNNRGNAARKLKRTEEAISNYREAIRLRSDHAEAHYNLGSILSDRKQHAEAASCYERALALQPDYPDALVSLAGTLAALDRAAEAVPLLDRAIALAPDRPDAWYARGAVQQVLGEHEAAIADYERAMALPPKGEAKLPKRALGDLAYALGNLCDWKSYESMEEQLREGVRDGTLEATSLLLLSLDDPQLQYEGAVAAARENYPAASEPLWRGERYAHDRIRVAYLSADFQDHATAVLMAELFETHDRSRFEISAISYGPDKASEMRSRLIAGFERFVDVREKSDLEIARLVREMEIDIAVDLKGYTWDARPGILAHRPAPVQATFLGYAGTMGVSYIDYIIADRIVIPPEDARWYCEKVVWLPDSYQVNDSLRPIDERTPTREETGLPPEGFVFCSFNNSYKITPRFYDVWARLLRNVPGSVLWLLGSHPVAESNLRREAQARGVDPARVVFAPRRPLPEHLARHRLADIFLDTLPINAHTTASDALWAGLPVLTCPGHGFAARVAASLNAAIGLPELNVPDLEAYEARALELATRPDALAAVKGKLARNRLATPLFDTARFRRHLEAAYVSMWESQQRGALPASFAVEAIG